MPGTSIDQWIIDHGDQLRALHAAGRTLTACAAEMDVPKSRISRASARLGLDWDRSRTAAATQAKVVDAKARRLAIIHRLYDEAEDLLAAVEKGRTGQGWKTILKGEYGREGVEELSFIPIRDRRDAADTQTRILGQAVRLEQVDSGGSEAVRGLLGGIAAQLGLDQPET